MLSQLRRHCRLVEEPRKSMNNRLTLLCTNSFQGTDKLQNLVRLRQFVVAVSVGRAHKESIHLLVRLESHDC